MEFYMVLNADWLPSDKNILTTILVQSSSACGKQNHSMGALPVCRRAQRCTGTQKQKLIDDFSCHLHPKRSRRLFLLALRLHILLLTIACLSNLPEEKNSFGSITTPWVSPFSCTISKTRPLFPGLSIPLIPLLVYYKDGLVSHEFIGVVSRLCGLQDFNPADITATDKK